MKRTKNTQESSMWAYRGLGSGDLLDPVPVNADFGVGARKSATGTAIASAFGTKFR